MQTFVCIACLHVAKLWYITCFTILGAIQSFRWPLLFHGTLHSDLDVFACRFLLRHHNPGCCLVNRSSRCTLESDSTNRISLRSSFRTIRRNSELRNVHPEETASKVVSPLSQAYYLPPFSMADASEREPAGFVSFHVPRARRTWIRVAASHSSWGCPSWQASDCLHDRVTHGFDSTTTLARCLQDACVESPI
jgi:hypothetical protein